MDYSNPEHKTSTPVEGLEPSEEMARRILSEVRHVTPQEAEEDSKEHHTEETPEPKKKNSLGRLFKQLFTGTILIREGVSEYYPYMISIALTFMVSIAVLFMTLHLDARYTRLEREVKVLRERSIRMQEQRFRHTTHSAITEKLRARGLELYDPHAPSEVIDD